MHTVSSNTRNWPRPMHLFDTHDNPTGTYMKVPKPFGTCAGCAFATNNNNVDNITQCAAAACAGGIIVQIEGYDDAHRRYAGSVCSSGGLDATGDNDAA